MSRRACHGRGEGEAEGNGEVGTPLVLLSLYEALLERAVCGLLKVGRAHQVLRTRPVSTHTHTRGKQGRQRAVACERWVQQRNLGIRMRSLEHDSPRPEQGPVAGWVLSTVLWGTVSFPQGEKY